MVTTIEHAPSSVQVPTRSQSRVVRAGLLLAALILAYAPLLWKHAQQLWIRPHYQFFPLAILGAAWLAYSRTRDLGPLTSGRARFSAIGIGLSLSILALAIVLDSSWLAAVSFPLLLASLAHSIGGWALLRRLLPALALLCIVVPPPLELDRNLILALQRQTTVWSSSLLDLIGIYHVMAGNVVIVRGQELLVDEACSGINSLFVIVACTLFVIFHERRPLTWGILLLTFAMGWVLLANVARVLLMTLLKARYNVDLTTGWKHEALGFAMFGCALLLIWSTDRLLRFLFLPSDEAISPASTDVKSDSSLPATKSRATSIIPSLGAGIATSWLVLLPLLALGAVQIESLIDDATKQRQFTRRTELTELKAETMPAKWGNWKQNGFRTETRNPGSYFGEISKMWAYELGKNQAVFSIDYPFPNWHDLTRCYTGQGWMITGERVHAPTSTTEGFVEVGLRRPGHREAYLLFNQRDVTGQPLRPRLGGAGLSLFRHGTRLERWQKLLTGQTVSSEIEVPPVFQIQLFVETFTELTPQERENVQAFFHHGLSRVIKHLPGDRGSEGENSQ